MPRTADFFVLSVLGEFSDPDSTGFLGICGSFQKAENTECSRLWKNRRPCRETERELCGKQQKRLYFVAGWAKKRKIMFRQVPKLSKKKSKGCGKPAGKPIGKRGLGISTKVFHSLWESYAENRCGK